MGLLGRMGCVGLVQLRPVVLSLVNAAPMALKPTADFGNFDALDIRAGRIVLVEDAQTRKPTYKPDH